MRTGRTYRRRIGSESGIQLRDAQFPYELGWVYVTPDARGKGYFIKCLNNLRDALAADDVFYGFPNHNSAPGFAKIGWQEKGVVTSWINVLPLVSQRRARDILALGDFDSRQDQFSNKLSGATRPCAARWGRARMEQYLRTKCLITLTANRAERLSAALGDQ